MVVVVAAVVLVVVSGLRVRVSWCMLLPLCALWTYRTLSACSRNSKPEAVAAGEYTRGRTETPSGFRGAG